MSFRPFLFPPFDEPLPAPDLERVDTFTATFPARWLPYVRGLVLALCTPTTYESDGEASANDATTLENAFLIESETPLDCSAVNVYIDGSNHLHWVCGGTDTDLGPIDADPKIKVLHTGSYITYTSTLIENNLDDYSVANGTLAANYDRLRCTYFVETTTQAGSVTLKLKLDLTTIMTMTFSTSTAQVIRIDMEITRQGPGAWEYNIVATDTSHLSEQFIGGEYTFSPGSPVEIKLTQQNNNNATHTTQRQAFIELLKA